MRRNSFKIGVVGMGYVGCVTAASLAKLGHPVVGVELDAEKVAMLQNGHAPLHEAGLDALLGDGIRESRLSFTQDLQAAGDVDLWIVCVGTPVDAHGRFDGQALLRVVSSLLEHGGTAGIAIRSTTLPDFLTREIGPRMDEAGRSYAVVPEFLREGSALQDFESPPMSIVGSNSHELGELLLRIFRVSDVPEVLTDVVTASCVKYACNAFHAAKIVFANEVGMWAKLFGADSQKVMQSITLDTRLNISPAYLRPGFAYGGSCLPKDLSAMLNSSNKETTAVDMLQGIHASNQKLLGITVREILKRRPGRIAMYGVSFKAGTDDLRGSPVIDLAQKLHKSGASVSAYDTKVFGQYVTGLNLRLRDDLLSAGVIERMSNWDVSALRGVDVVVFGHTPSESDLAVVDSVHPPFVVNLTTTELAGSGWKAWSPTH